jgi:hypothetical protein
VGEQPMPVVMRMNLLLKKLVKLVELRMQAVMHMNLHLRKLVKRVP